LLLRLRTNDVLAWRHPEQAILSAIIGARRLNAIQYPPSILIGVTKRLNIGIADRFAVSIDDPAPNRTGRCHPNSDIGCVLLRRERDRHTGSVRSTLTIFRRYVAVLCRTKAILARCKIAKCKLTVGIDNNRLTRYR
jgi:hypothetical protein